LARPRFTKDWRPETEGEVHADARSDRGDSALSGDSYGVQGERLKPGGTILPGRKSEIRGGGEADRDGCTRGE